LSCVVVGPNQDVALVRPGFGTLALFVDFRVRVTDNGEPRTSDTFDIILGVGGNPIYSTFGGDDTLKGGNIQRHKPNPSTTGKVGGSVTIDGGAATSVDTAHPVARGSPGLTSEVVFTASSLTAGSHTIAGTTTSGGAHIIVDAFDVTP